MKIHFLAILFIFVACNNKAPKTNASNSLPKESPVTKLDSLLLNYIVMKDGFIKEDTSVLQKTIANFIVSIENAKAENITDTFKKNIISKALQNLNPIVNKLNNAKSIEEKRKAFKDITKPLQQILAIQSYTTIYVQHCPMANEYSDDAKVYWISDNEKIYNPFYPKTMGRCGIVTDTIKKTK